MFCTVRPIRESCPSESSGRSALFIPVPPEVKVVVGPLRPSEFPDYDAVTITFDNGGKKQDHEFLLSKDHKTLLRMTKFDLTKDPDAEVMKKIDVAGRPTRGNKDAKVWPSTTTISSAPSARACTRRCFQTC